MENLSFEYLGPNYVLNSSEGWYVSYNPKAKNGPFDTFSELIGEPEITGETALYDGEIWYILKGDFREQYLNAFALGLTVCLDVYQMYKDQYRSNWSTD